MTVPDEDDGDGEGDNDDESSTTNDEGLGKPLAMQTDRERGLSEADRKYLLGISDIEERSGAERNTRQRIRGRVFSQLLDNSIIQSHLRTSDKIQLLEFDFENNPEKYEATQEAVIGSLALIYELAKRENQSFKSLLEKGIERVEGSGTTADTLEIAPPEAHVSIDVSPAESLNLAAINRKVQQLNAVLDVVIDPEIDVPEQELDEADFPHFTTAERLFLLWNATRNPSNQESDFMLELVLRDLEEHWNIPDELIEAAMEE